MLEGCCSEAAAAEWGHALDLCEGTQILSHTVYNYAIDRIARSSSCE